MLLLLLSKADCLDIKIDAGRHAGDAVFLGSAYSTEASSRHSRPCDSATAG